MNVSVSIHKHAACRRPVSRVSFVLLFLFCLSLPITAKDFTIVIDPGHGGNEPGAVGRFTKEKDITLNVALKVGKLIANEMKDVRVIYTRNRDVAVSLHERARIANHANADLFLSIHTNSAPGKDSRPQGSETFSMGLARSEANMEVAKRENAVVLLEKDYKEHYAGFNPNSTESYIIFELMQDKYMEQSVHFASLIQKQFKNYGKRIDRGVKQAGFLVLRATSMPSVLTEIGFISNSAEEQYMASEAGSNTLAQGIFRAFREYKAEHDRRVSKAAATTANNSDKSASTNTSQAASGQSNTQNNALAQTTTTTAGKTTTTSTSAPVFKIQVLASSTRLANTDKRLKGLSPISHYQEQNLYKYTYGESTDYNEVYALRRKILSNFPSAFIIAFSEGKRMDVQEAIRIFKANKK